MKIYDYFYVFLICALLVAKIQTLSEEELKIIASVSVSALVGIIYVASKLFAEK